MGRRGKKNQLYKVETFRGRCLLTLISASTSGSVNIDGTGLNGTGSSRFGNFTDQFSEFRVTMMELNFFSGSGGGLGNCAVGYYQGPSDTPPTTIGNVVVSECSAVSWGSTTVPTILRVPRSVLIGGSAQNWWKTRPGTTGSDWDEIQGQIVAACGTAGTLQALVTWEVECTGFIASSSTPLPKPIALKEDPLVAAARLVLLQQAARLDSGSTSSSSPSMRSTSPLVRQAGVEGVSPSVTVNNLLGRPVDIER